MASALTMLEAGKAKPALWAAALSMLALNLIFCFSCEVEALRIKFSVSSGQELVHAEWNQVFVNLDFDRLIFACALDSEACFDVYKGEPEKRL